MTYISYPGGVPDTTRRITTPPLDYKEGQGKAEEASVTRFLNWLEGYLEGKDSLDENQLSLIRVKLFSYLYSIPPVAPPTNPNPLHPSHWREVDTNLYHVTNDKSYTITSDTKTTNE